MALENLDNGLEVMAPFPQLTQAGKPIQGVRPAHPNEASLSFPQVTAPGSGQPVPTGTVPKAITGWDLEKPTVDVLAAHKKKGLPVGAKLSTDQTMNAEFRNRRPNFASLSAKEKINAWWGGKLGDEEEDHMRKTMMRQNNRRTSTGKHEVLPQWAGDTVDSFGTWVQNTADYVNNPRGGKSRRATAANYAHDYARQKFGLTEDLFGAGLSYDDRAQEWRWNDDRDERIKREIQDRSNQPGKDFATFKKLRNEAYGRLHSAAVAQYQGEIDIQAKERPGFSQSIAQYELPVADQIAQNNPEEAKQATSEAMTKEAATTPVTTLPTEDTEVTVEKPSQAVLTAEGEAQAPDLTVATPGTQLPIQGITANITPPKTASQMTTAGSLQQQLYLPPDKLRALSKSSGMTEPELRRIWSKGVASRYGLNDIAINPSTGKPLAYQTSDGKWINAGASGITAIADPQNPGNVLAYKIGDKVMPAKDFGPPKMTAKQRMEQQGASRGMESFLNKIGDVRKLVNDADVSIVGPIAGSKPGQWWDSIQAAWDPADKDAGDQLERFRSENVVNELKQVTLGAISKAELDMIYKMGAQRTNSKEAWNKYLTQIQDTTVAALIENNSDGTVGSMKQHLQHFIDIGMISKDAAYRIHRKLGNMNK